MPTDQLLSGVEGRWSGTYRLWLEPSVLRVESSTECVATRVLDRRNVLFDYEWTDLDGQQFGTMLVGRPAESEVEMTLIDTWHTGSSSMHCPGIDLESLTGTYGPVEALWSWRTHIHFDGDELVFTAWNISPDGEASKATEATYRRAA